MADTVEDTMRACHELRNLLPVRVSDPKMVSLVLIFPPTKAEKSTIVSAQRLPPPGTRASTSLSENAALNCRSRLKFATPIVLTCETNCPTRALSGLRFRTLAVISGSAATGGSGVRRDEARFAAAGGGALCVAAEGFFGVDAGSAAAIFVRGTRITD